MINYKGNLVVISGPSGVGKSTLVKAARQVLPDLAFSVSCTTRSMRSGEVHGKDYYFLSPEEFEKKVAANEFIEYAGVFNHRYGTLKSEINSRLAAGEQILLDIDVQGAKQIRAAAAADPELSAIQAYGVWQEKNFIMIVPPSFGALESRLANRNSETPEQLALRLAAAKSELSNFRIYDYIVVNDDLERAGRELIAVLTALRLRSTLITGEPFV